jgi:very-short-patch-repair endonuclease
MSEFIYRTANPDVYALLKKFAKKNRANPTIAETILWQHLRGKSLGAKFQRQHVVLDFIADFICIESQLIIEVDGSYHLVDNQIVKDRIRDERLLKIGYKILRVTNDEVLNDIDGVIQKIKDNL